MATFPPHQRFTASRGWRCPHLWPATRLRLSSWMSGASFSSLSFPPCNFSLLVHVGKHRRQRSFRQPVFILSRPRAPRLHLCLSAVAHSARLTARSLSSCQPRHPKVLCLKFNVWGDQNGEPRSCLCLFLTLATNRSLGDLCYFQPCPYFVLEQMIVRL